MLWSHPELSWARDAQLRLPTGVCWTARVPFGLQSTSQPLMAPQAWQMAYLWPQPVANRHALPDGAPALLLHVDKSYSCARCKLRGWHRRMLAHQHRADCSAGDQPTECAPVQLVALEVACNAALASCDTVKEIQALQREQKKTKGGLAMGQPPPQPAPSMSMQTRSMVRQVCHVNESFRAKLCATSPTHTNPSRAATLRRPAVATPAQPIQRGLQARQR